MLEEFQETAPLDIQEQIDFKEADKGKRFFNMLIDIAGYFALSFLLGGLLGGYMLFNKDAANSMMSMGSIGKIISVLLGFIIMFFYFFLYEFFFGLTPGKLITNTRVVTEDGNKLSFSRAVGRTLCRFIPFDNFSFLGNRGWHDSISKTMVVNRYQKDSILLPIIITVILFITGGGIFLQTKVVSNFKHDTESTVYKDYTYHGLSFVCSENWKIDTTEMQNGNAHQIVFSKAGYSGNESMAIVFIEMPIDINAWMEQTIKALKTQPFYKTARFSEIENSVIAGKSMVIVDLTGEMMGIEQFGRISGYNEGMFSIMIIKQADSEQKLDNEFRKIQESIKVSDSYNVNYQTEEENALED